MNHLDLFCQEYLTVDGVIYFLSNRLVSHQGSILVTLKEIYSLSGTPPPTKVPCDELWHSL